MTNINKIENINLTSNCFTVYDYEAMTMQELLSTFFTKINECVDLSNRTNEINEWLLTEGLNKEVVKQLLLWLDNGTLESTVVSGLLNTINKNLKNKSNILDYSHLVSDDDWTIAINTAIEELSEGGELFFPGGTYLISDTIKYKGGCKLVGNKLSSVIKLMSADKTLIDMSEGSESFQSTLEGIQFEGIGKNKLQTCIKLNGWGTVLKDCTIHKFMNGVKGCGVIVEIDNCYIHNNEIGINCIVLENGAPSTMFSIRNTMVHYNDLGVYYTDYDNPNGKRPMISFVMDRVAFEWNNKAYDLPATMNGVIKNCWFEQNTERPTTHASGWIFENNRYEPSNSEQRPQFKSREWQEYGFGGYTENESGEFSTKNIKLQTYNNTNLLPEYHNLNTNGETLMFNNKKVMMSNDDKTNNYYIAISNNNMDHNLGDGKVKFTRLSEGEYRINLIGCELRYPIININAYNQHASHDSITFTSRLVYSDHATYQEWFTVNEINVSVKNNSLPVDGKVIISILTNKLF